MKNPNDMRFESVGISELNGLLEARELTGQMPQTLPTGLKVEGNKNSRSYGSGSDYCTECDCNCNDCDCGPDSPQCECDDCYCNGFYHCDSDCDCSSD